MTDNRGTASTASTVTITVNPLNANAPPTANAGPAQTVTSGTTVTLNGSASSDPDGTIASYAWSQAGGSPTVTLTGPATAQPTFLAPTVTSATTLNFSLVVTDNQGATSAASTVAITVTGGLKIEAILVLRPYDGISIVDKSTKTVGNTVTRVFTIGADNTIPAGSYQVSFAPGVTGATGDVTPEITVANFTLTVTQ